MTNTLITPLIPRTDDAAYALLLACLADATHATLTELKWGWNPRDEMRDADDYICASTAIAATIAAALTTMTSPLDAFHTLIANDDFREDCLTADFNSDLPRLFEYSD